MMLQFRTIWCLPTQIHKYVYNKVLFKFNDSATGSFIWPGVYNMHSDICETPKSACFNFRFIWFFFFLHQNLITTLPTVRMIVDVSKSGIVLSIQSIIKLLKTREAAASIDPKSWPPILDIDDNPKRKLAAIANSSLDSTAYLDFSVSTCGRLSGVIMTHRYEQMSRGKKMKCNE